MGLFLGGRPERRDSGYYPAIPPNSQTGSFFGSRRVDLSRTESSLQKVAIYASVRLLREVVTMLPIDFYTQSGTAPASPIPTPKWLSDPSGDGYGLTDWIGQAVYSDAMRGNVVARVLARDPQSGQPRQLMLHHPDDVNVFRVTTDAMPQWTICGEAVDRADVWHRRSFAIPGSVWGLSPIGAHALTIGQGLSAAQFGVQWFLDGAHPSSILQNEDQAEIKQDQAASVKRKFMAAIKGTREPVVMGKGWKYTPIQVAANESQFLETQSYTNAECARIFGPGMPEMLGYETGGTQTYANLEQRNLHLLQFTLDPWLVRVEKMLYDLLPRPQYAKFNRDALLRTDLLTRFRAHEIAIRNEFETVNEVRELEDRKPVDWGDTPSNNPKFAPMPVAVEPP